ncbi:hypothetical protein CGRA01v4_14919 [Colletotrichum graminicola]|nr:hypothetical protein CGRA01v4_14919 [Colletotrichum graminicola]
MPSAHGIRDQLVPQRPRPRQLDGIIMLLLGDILTVPRWHVSSQGASRPYCRE